MLAAVVRASARCDEADFSRRLSTAASSAAAARRRSRCSAAQVQLTPQAGGQLRLVDQRRATSAMCNSLLDAALAHGGAAS